MSDNWPLRLVFPGGVALLGLLWSIHQELDPLTGDWQVARSIEGGKSIPNTNHWFLSLDISGGYATFATYQTCGERSSTSAEGVMVRHGNCVDLYRRVRMTPDLEKQPNGRFQILPSGEIAFDTSGTAGEPVQLVFQRVRNSETLLDLIGWK